MNNAHSRRKSLTVLHSLLVLAVKVVAIKAKPCVVFSSLHRTVPAVEDISAQPAMVAAIGHCELLLAVATRRCIVVAHPVLLRAEVLDIVEHSRGILIRRDACVRREAIGGTFRGSSL